MMSNLTSDYIQSKKEVENTIVKCERILPKFKIGTSQHTLLINRINALNISKHLIEKELSQSIISLQFSKKELEDALKPIESIIHKCKKAQSKYELSSNQYKRYSPLIDSMEVCKTLIERELMI
ncbi:MAG: hypothetical protein HGA35_02200 [Erysipelotrichaceae bacterium]|nr:hypothetical protein [Erysipelotrichaceae bacterium]